MANAPKFGSAYKKHSPDFRMNKLAALSLLSEAFIASKPHPTASDFDAVAAALRDWRQRISARRRC